MIAKRRTRTRRPERIDENATAAAIDLDGAMLQRIDDLAQPGLAKGTTLM
jgi:diketogulonate reductase-like aldo/keto reductase